MVRTCVYLLLLLLLGLPVTQPAQAAEPAHPVLRYDPPAEFRLSPFSPPDEYSSVDIWPSASIRFYPFRPFSGDIQREFRQTLLRDWIEGFHREVIVPIPPTFSALQIPGAQAAVAVRFSEGTSKIARQRVRVLIVVKGMAALMDVSAGDLDSWQRIEPALDATLASLYVEGGISPPRPPLDARHGAAYRAVAGLYLGSKPRRTHNPGSHGDAAAASHYYLFSADGRVYRRYDFPPAGAEVQGQAFDFDAAERDDPLNCGRFTLKGDRLRMEFGRPRQVEVIHTEAPQRGRIVIDSAEYFLQN